MQSSSEGYFDVIELAKELRSEKLFIQSELESLRQLNERLEKSALELAEAVWTTAQQRSHLKQLFAQGDFGSSSSCCQVTDFVLSPVFVDAHKVLRYQDALVLSELIQRIRASPDVASLWLAASEGDRGGAGAAARALCAGLHAAGAHGGAVGPARAVLRHLAVHRLATAEDPRKMISQESSSFSRLYSEVVEGFRPARMFLMAALRGPLLPLLQLDECLLVDPDKALDRIKKLFNPNSSNSECEQKLTKYRKWTITSLAESASRFIKSLAEHWACFPPSIAWIVRQTALALRATRRIPEEDIHAICTDLVFTNFICQAIINPEAFGVTDIPITNVGRFNLVQVAQTLQMLCLMKYQDIDGKLRDLYSRFEKDAVYSLLDVLLEDGSYSALAEEVVESEAADLEQGILGGVPCRSEAFSVEPVVTANVALFTRNDLQLLVSLLKKIPSFVSNGFDSSPEQINNSASSSSLHQDFQELSIYNAKNSNSNLEPAKNTNGNIASDKNSPDDMENSGETDVACGVTPTSNASDAGKIDRSSADFPQNDGLSQLLRNIQPEQLIRLQKLLKRLPESNFAQEPTPPKKPSKGKHNGTNGNSAFSLKNGGKKSDKSPQLSQEVLVIKLPGDTAYEPIGMIPESKVLAAHYMNVTSGLLCQDSEMEIPLEATTQEAAHPPDPKPMEKRTRFSLSHDEGSIGNTSDNLEAVSEAASNHSVTSSLEMETEDQNDNLSDMVSANVSGRGSPNISGRDTPSSQVTEGDAAVGLAMPQVLRHPIAPISSNIASKQVKLMKRTRNDIEDKFCKFEIKKLLEGDETISIISDTWSTDVLASDSETLGESNYDRNFIAQQNALAAAVAAQQALPLVAPPAPDVSETASESAWSTDALVSDSDRMTEVDMDDCSVARSDTGTARSGGDAPTPQQPHLFSPLNNINRDALLNRRQMNAASSVHTAHPDNMPAGPALPDADGGAFRSNHDTVDNLVVLRSPNRGRSNVSPLYMQTGAASDARSSAAVASLGVRLRSPGRRPVPYHGGATDPSSTASSVCSDSNGVLVNGYHVVPSCYSRLPQPGPSRGGAGAGALDSPLSALDSPGGQHNTYSAYSDGRQRSDLLFDFARAGLNEASNHSVLESEVSTPEGMFHSANSPFVQAVSNGNATSRWLNDPSQKFPIRPEPETPKPSCSNTTTRETIGSVCNNLDEIHSVFKPIVVERNLSDVDDSGIEHSDINERCPILGYMNGDNLSNQELNSTLSSESSFNGVNGFNERFQDNTPAVRFESNTLRTIDFNAEGPMVSRVHSTSMKTTQHSFVSNNLVSNTISRVMKTSESRTSVINISSSRIDKPSAKIDSPLNGVSSGSAISLSTLSVNSADTSTSDRSSSQDVNSENLTERRVTPPLNVSILSSTEVKVQRGPTSGSNGCATLPRNASTPCTTLMKPGASTGAIPKSISFDATAEKSHRYQSRRAVDDSNEGSGLNFGELKNNVKRSGGNLLNKIKIFRNRSRGFTSSAGFGKRSNHQEYAEDISKAGGDCDLEGSGLSVPETSRAEDAAQPGTSSTQHKSNAELSDDILAKYRRKASSSSDAAASDSTSHSGHSASGAGAEGGGAAGGSQGGGEAGGDPAEQEALNGRLRVVLASMDVHSLEVSAARSGPTSLSCLLRLEGGGGALAALGALSTLGGARAPLGALRAAAASRRPYLQYLADCRRALIAAIAELESDLAWQRAESLRQAALASAARARVSLAAREPRLAALQERMRAGLADEKRDILAAALHALLQDIAAEDAWAGAGEWELEQVALTVERAVLGRVYLLAMFPNGDGDSLRDQVLHDHIVALSAGGVGLPERRLAGAPWTQAQRILAHLPAYKTPRDKVECVSRCLSSIMTLLSLSLEGSTPGADDLTPVLVYVIIKVNPPSLLSTVQFVSTFLSAPLEGEQLYCWTQFCSAVEYIKTLDYSRPSRR